MKFDLEIGRIELDEKLFTAPEFSPVVEGALNDVKATHEDLYDAGKAPDGSSQKAYSEAYKRQIKAGKVQAGKGGVKKTSTTPNLKISGGMRGAQQVVKKSDNEIQLAYIDSDQADKASYLRELGFKHSYLSPKDQTYITKACLNHIKRNISRLVKISKPK